MPLEQRSAEFWESMYWYNVSLWPEHDQVARARGLVEKNEEQAAKLMEQDFLLSCIHRVGQTIYVDYKALLRRICMLEEELPPVIGLAASKYIKDKL
jgi:hypothetical protein